MSRKNKKVRMSSRIDLADALRKESSLSAFTFDGPYRLTGHDLLDNMYCADNGRWYETPVDWYTQFSDARVFTEPGFTKSIVGNFAASIMVLTVDSLRPIILANS